MADAPVRVIARVTARADKMDELRTLLIDLVGPSRAEPGCVSYQVCESNEEPGEFVCIEEWSNAQALDAHMRSPHVEEAFAKAPPLLAKPPEIRSYSILR